MTLQVEFQAVVLAAGKGSRMPEITSGKPKCLLPVGPKPLVWYPLQKLQQSGFSDAILIVLDTQKSEIQSTLDKTDLDIRIDYITISDNKDLGTADSLRFISDRLKSDVLVLSCDLITDASLSGVLDTFRMHDASIAALLFHPEPSEGPVLVPGVKSKHKPERDLIGIDTQTDRLVFLASASDFETELSLPRSLLKKHTSINMFSNLLDSHVYVLKNWVIKYLASQPNVSTLKGELLPHIIKKQLSKPPKKSGEDKSVVSDSEDIFRFAEEDEFVLRIRETSSYNDHSGDLKPIYHGDSIRCYGHFAPKGAFGARINTLPAYCSVNNKITGKWEKITGGLGLVLQHPKAENKSTQVDEKCIIWEGAKLSEKTSFKNSIIGMNTQISSFSRVFNCILMNNVKIGEKVALENCIVSDGAEIDVGCNIKNCLIGSQHLVPKESEHNQEVLTDSNRFMEF